MKYAFIIFILIFVFPANEADNKGNGTTKSTQISGVKKPPSGMKTQTTTKSSSEFEAFKKKYSKSYRTKSEEAEARKNFEQNVQNDKSHNANNNKTYQRGPNKYSDKSHSWKVSNRMGAKKSKAQSTANSLPVKSSSLSARMGETETIPDNANWTDWNSPVRDQADCGSCWIFASLAVLEYLMIVIRENYTVLSTQEILDCNSFGNACDGGWPTDSFNYIIQNGITTEKFYPYLSYQSECYGKRFPRNLFINETYEQLLDGDEDMLKSIVFNYGPTAVVIYASDSFTQYAGGVFSEEGCPNDPESYNHAITVVGYGTNFKEGDFWIIKNSWGKDWGEYGYGRIARNKGNMCGIANYAMNPSSSWIAETNFTNKRTN